MNEYATDLLYHLFQPHIKDQTTIRSVDGYIFGDIWQP